MGLSEQEKRKITDIYANLCRVSGLSPEWLWTHESIFSDQDTTPALLDVPEGPKGWWEEEPTNMEDWENAFGVHNTVERVKRYLENSA